MVIAIIVPIGVPGMILSLWDMSAFGLGNKAHRCFGRENGFWKEGTEKEIVGKKRGNLRRQKDSVMQKLGNEGEEEVYTGRELLDWEPSWADFCAKAEGYCEFPMYKEQEIFWSTQIISY